MTATLILLIAALAQPPIPDVQMLCIQSDHCAPCRDAERNEKTGYRPWLERSGWMVSPVANSHFRLIDADMHRELVEVMRVEAVPCFVLMKSGREVRRWEGYPGRDALVKAYIEAAKESK